MLIESTYLYCACQVCVKCKEQSVRSVFDGPQLMKSYDVVVVYFLLFDVEIMTIKHCFLINSFLSFSLGSLLVHDQVGNHQIYPISLNNFDLKERLHIFNTANIPAFLQYHLHFTNFLASSTPSAPILSKLTQYTNHLSIFPYQNHPPSIPFYHYNFNTKTGISMRTLFRRNTRNEPCKSPSPDIAGKNIIKNTTIQVQDIRSKMKKAQQKQLKFDLQSSLSQIAPSDNLSVDVRYRQVFEEFNKLKYENKLLADQNRLLNQENQRLNLQEERNKNLNQLNNLLLSKNENELLRDKIVVLDEEKKRVERELQNQREKGQQSHKNIERLRLELLSVRDGKGEKRGASDQEGRFILLSNNILNDYEEKMNRKLEEINYRINRIEMMEKIIKEQHSRLVAQSRVNKTPSSVKSYNWANNTTVKNDSRYRELPHTQERSQKEAMPLSSSPIDKHYKLDESVMEKLQQENISLAEQLRIRDSEIERMKIERQRMSAIIHDLQLEKKAMKISTPKFNNSDDNIFRKFVTLQESVGHYQNETDQLNAQNAQLKQQLASMESSNAIEKRQSINKIQYLQKIIKSYEEKQKTGQCQQCLKEDQEIIYLREKLKRFDHSLNELQKKFKEDIQDYQRKLEHSESAGSQKFRNLDEQYKKLKQFNGQLVLQLSNYKMMLEYIKDKIRVDQIDELMKQNSAIYTEVESTFYQEREEYDKCISGYRQKALESQQKMLKCQSQLQLRIKQAELLRVEVERLRQINTQLQDNGLTVLKSNLKFMGRERESKGKVFERNTEQVLELVRSGQTKLDILYQKVNNSIHFDLQQSRRT